LAQEGGPVDGPQTREEVAEVAPEVGVQAVVGVEAEELADDLDRRHLAVREDRHRGCPRGSASGLSARIGIGAVREDRHRAALTRLAIMAEVAGEVVHEAENGDDGGLQVHGCPSLRLIHREERRGTTNAPSTTLLLENPHTGSARD
jgi:hypothetical protein